MKKISHISFDDSSKEFVLGILGKSIDSEGYIIESDTGNRVLYQDGEPIHSDDFGGVRKGSEIFFKNDLPSVLNAIQEASNAHPNNQPA
jgi:hypothetical protein